MTPERWQQVARVYQSAMKQEPSTRNAYLTSVCGDDAELRREVESLLAQPSAPGLIDRPLVDVAAHAFEGAPNLAPGTMVGSYRVVGLIGEGGMGQVYRAQDTKLPREVALKILPDAAQNAHFARRRTKRPTLLQGLLVCAQCGYAIYRRRGVYRCWGRDGYEHPHGPVCATPSIREDHLDALVWREVLRLLEDPTLVEAELARRREVARQGDPTRQRVDELTRHETRVVQAIERLVTAYQQDLVTLDDLRTRMPPLRTQQQTIAAERQALETAAVDQARYLRLSETLTDFRDRLRARGDALSLADRQQIVRLLIKEIRVAPNAITICHSLPIGGPGPDDGRPGGFLSAEGRSRNGSPKWLLHVRGQSPRLRAR